MDLSRDIEQPNESNSSIPTKRKRTTQVRSESQNEQVNPDVSTIDGNLIGQLVCGVVEGSSDDGYILNLKIKDATKEFHGVFIPNKVTPVTPPNHLFPQVEMDSRNDIPIPSFNHQTADKGKKKVTSENDLFPLVKMDSRKYIPVPSFTSSYNKPTLEVLQNVENLTRIDQQRSPMHPSAAYIVPEVMQGMLEWKTMSDTDIASGSHQSLQNNRLMRDLGISSMMQMPIIASDETNIPVHFASGRHQSLQDNRLMSHLSTGSMVQMPILASHETNILVDSQVNDVSTEEKLALQPILDSEEKKDKILHLMLKYAAKDDKPKEYYTSKKPEDAIIELYPAFRKHLEPILDTIVKLQSLLFTLLSGNDVTSKEDNTTRLPGSEDCAASNRVSLSNVYALIESILSFQAPSSRIHELRNEELRSKRNRSTYKGSTKKTNDKDQEPPAT